MWWCGVCRVFGSASKCVTSPSEENRPITTLCHWTREFIEHFWEKLQSNPEIRWLWWCDQILPFRWEQSGSQYFHEIKLSQNRWGKVDMQHLYKDNESRGEHEATFHISPLSKPDQLALHILWQHFQKQEQSGLACLSEPQRPQAATTAFLNVKGSCFFFQRGEIWKIWHVNWVLNLAVVLVTIVIYVVITGLIFMPWKTTWRPVISPRLLDIPVRFVSNVVKLNMPWSVTTVFIIDKRKNKFPFPGRLYSLDTACEKGLQKLGHGIAQCLVCHKTWPSYSKAKQHFEAKHFQSEGHQCEICYTFCKTKHALECHMSKKHRFQR